MKNKKFTLFVLMACLFSFAGLAQSEFNVAPNGIDDGNPSLDAFIAGKDTVSSQALTFILERNGLYILGNTINATNDITIKAAEGDGYKPVIVMGTNDEGAQNAWNMGAFSGDLTIDGIQFMCANELHQRGGWANGGLNMNTGGLNVTINNCIIDHQDAVFISAWSGGIGDFTFTNNLVRFNGGPASGNWHGYIIDCKGGPAGNVYVENNTFMEGMAAVLTMDGANYFESLWINHNTFVNRAVFPFSTFYAHEGAMMNNLYVNAGFGGETYSWWSGNCNENEPRGILDLCAFQQGEDTVEYTIGDQTFKNPPEEDRVFLAAYNNNFFSDGIAEWREKEDKGQLSKDTVNGVGWWKKPEYPAESEFGFMNEATYNRMMDDDTYPYYVWDPENTLSARNEDPGFSDYSWDDDDLIAFARYMGNDPDTSYTLDFGSGAWGIGPDVNTLTLPVDEDQYDLSYNNETLMNAGHAGYPIGDLNWFPEKKAEWENDPDKENYDDIIASVLDGSFEFVDWNAKSGIFGREKTVGYYAFPNPVTHGTLYVKGMEYKLKTVYNLTGQILVQTRENQIDVSDLKSGMYLLEIENSIQKVVVK